MKILNPRGTSGSGKSSLVRQLMGNYPRKQPLFEVGRKRPIAYIYSRDIGASLFIIGHYETACGGGDTVKTPDRVYELIHQGIDQEYDVIFEGVISQDDTKRLLALNAEHPVNVIELSTPIEECLAGIQLRRDERNDVRPLNPKNTIARADRVHKICDKLRAQGLKIPYLNREEAYQYCKELLTTANK